MEWLDKKYTALLSGQLERFAWINQQVARARCPLCGDSQQSKTKARLYLYPHKGQYMVKCHNCQASLPFSAFLKRVSARLYSEYLVEKLRDERLPEDSDEDVFSGAFTTAPAGVQRDPLRYLIPLNTPSLAQPNDPLHEVWAYARGRHIPTSQMGRLMATNQAVTWLQPLVGEEKAARVQDGLSYLVIPLTLPNGEMCGCQLRLLTRHEYITFKWGPYKIFGLDHRVSTLPTIITEGPIDSLFVPNAIAACSSDLQSIVRQLEDDKVMLPTEPRVYCWDAEPRNLSIVRLMKIAIDAGEKVVIWPRGAPKDLNDCASVGFDVPALLKKYTYQGLRAQLEFSYWKI